MKFQVSTFNTVGVCTALLLNEIYLPTQFLVDILCSFRVMSMMNKMRMDRQTICSPRSIKIFIIFDSLKLRCKRFLRTKTIKDQIFCLFLILYHTRISDSAKRASEESISQMTISGYQFLLKQSMIHFLGNLWQIRANQGGINTDTRSVLCACEWVVWSLVCDAGASPDTV